MSSREQELAEEDLFDFMAKEAVRREGIESKEFIVACVGIIQRGITALEHSALALRRIADVQEAMMQEQKAMMQRNYPSESNKKGKK